MIDQELRTNKHGLASLSAPDTASRIPNRPSALDVFVLAIALLHAASAFGALFELIAPTLPLSTTLWLLLYSWVVIATFAHQGAYWIASTLTKHFLLSTVVIIALASAVWSLAAELTIQRSVHLLGSTLIALYLGYHFPPRSLFSLLSWVLAILIIGGSLWALAFPEHGQQDYDGSFAWRGMEGNKNAFGTTAATGAILFTVRVVTEEARRWRWFTLALLSMLALFMAESATSLAALLFAVLATGTFAVVTTLRLPPVIAVFAFFVWSAGAAAVIAVAGLDDLIAVMGRSPMLTGRMDLWALIWEIVQERPLSGYGYGALWFPRPGTETLQQEILGLSWTAYHAHNGFLGVATELGIPAAVLLTAYVAHALVRSARLYLRAAAPFALFGIGYQCMFLVSNVAEARMLTDRSLPWLLFVTMSVALLRSFERCRFYAYQARMLRCAHLR